VFLSASSLPAVAYEKAGLRVACHAEVLTKTDEPRPYEKPPSGVGEGFFPSRCSPFSAALRRCGKCSFLQVSGPLSWFAQDAETQGKNLIRRSPPDPFLAARRDGLAGRIPMHRDCFGMCFGLRRSACICGQSLRALRALSEPIRVICVPPKADLSRHSLGDGGPCQKVSHDSFRISCFDIRISPLSDTNQIPRVGICFHLLVFFFHPWFSPPCFQLVSFFLTCCNT
jgi:hypothetical protein